MSLSLAKVRSFVAIAEARSFRKASETLRLSQPALSMQMHDLEADLGVKLLSRTTRRVELTAEGAFLLAGAMQMLAAFDATVAELRNRSILRTGRVIVGCVSTFAAQILPPILGEFARLYPKVSVTVFDGSAAALYRQLLEREADLGIGPAPTGLRELEFVPLLQDHFVAVFPRRHPLARRPEVTLAELQGLPLLLKVKGSDARTRIAAAFAAHGYQLNPAFEVYQHHTLGGMIEAGLGITLLPASSVALLGNRSFKTARIIEPDITRDTGILRLRGNKPSASAAAFQAFLQDRLSSGRAPRRPLQEAAMPS